MVTAPDFNCEQTLIALKKAGAKRVLLAMEPLAEKMTDVYGLLKRCIDFFSAHGLKCGVWFWAFMVNSDRFTPIIGNAGKSNTQKCPLDPDFLVFAQNNVKRIAALKPELILFDDDLRLGFLDSGFGCVCEHHRKLMEQVLSPLPDDIYAEAFSAKPNKCRDAFLFAMGESLKIFCKKMREAVDEIAPEVRMGICSCLSTWDTDGVDSYTLSRLLAGNTRPYIRLIGAPYWAVNRNWGNRLQDTVELERMERAWCDDDDFEIVSEGDTYPRPRYTTPASYLELFDTALRFTQKMTGIQKYMLDYTSSALYEPDYIEAHLHDASVDIEGFVAGTQSTGIRVYEKIDKLKDAFLSVPVGRVQDMFFSTAAKFLAANGLPSVYEGTGCAGIAFGENVKVVSEYSQKLILDFDAAMILQSSGVDVGIAAVVEAYSPSYEHYIKENENIAVYTCLDSPANFAHEVKLKEGAKLLSEFVCGGGYRIPASYTYGNFLVYCFSNPPESIWRNYLRPKHINEFAAPPVSACGHPDLYLQCSENEDTCVIGVWNCHADGINGLKISLAHGFSGITFLNASGKLDGNAAVIDYLPPFSYALVKLER